MAAQPFCPIEAPNVAERLAIPCETPSFLVCVSIFRGIAPMLVLEVKANVSTNNNSLTKFNKENDNKISVRLSLNNLKQDGKIINIPLYLIEYIDKFF